MGTDSEDVRDNVLETENEGTAANPASSRDRADPNDDVPVPVAMSPAEIDERAQVVEALRNQTAGKKRGDDDAAKPLKA